MAGIVNAGFVVYPAIHNDDVKKLTEQGVDLDGEIVNRPSLYAVWDKEATERRNLAESAKIVKQNREARERQENGG